MKATCSNAARNHALAGGKLFFASLEEVIQTVPGTFNTQPRLLQSGEIRDAYLRAARRLLVLDYDGTLVPFANWPHQAVPPQPVLDLLSALASNPKNRVALVSGRSASDLEGWFGRICELYLVAEHGAEFKTQSVSQWESLRPEASTDWKLEVRTILDHFVRRTPASFVEEKKYGLVWHYRMAEPRFAARLASELVSTLNAMLAGTELRVFRGEKIVEVKPIWANKGEAIQQLLGGFRHPDFIFAAGDDGTDEDLFERAPNSAWTVHVGPGPTRASFMVTDVQVLRGVLELLVAAGGVGCLV
jgi:trehalose 6-phosphate synthase/phosphatase